jgi:hypothetical protein
MQSNDARQNLMTGEAKAQGMLRELVSRVDP